MMIDTNNVSIESLRKAYDFRSSAYDKTVAISELEYHKKALDKIQWHSHLKILEVATGPGRVLLEIAKRTGNAEPIYGIELSKRMLELAEKRMVQNGYENIVLKQGDCRHLPWTDNSFDILYNGYMMDLIPADDMQDILKEMYRVLKPGGKLIMVNMSKNEESNSSFLEHLYQFLPKLLVLYIMGNCRPVLMKEPVSIAGFVNIAREYHHGKHPTEIIIANKE
ncbi:class I SAM-dependent methyltransferase [Hahella ganghwensis]|uniref:class I SAM-dependent methyltransferase n=1 Tax=Hahella ganghwensis TaxID=286420 RepID=UPI0012F7B5C6|nr:class I SAM-dependent methyltransferase [Hahella ganghwensis]